MPWDPILLQYLILEHTGTTTFAIDTIVTEKATRKLTTDNISGDNNDSVEPW